jgi:hypothetical protein
MGGVELQMMGLGGRRGGSTRIARIGGANRLSLGEIVGVGRKDSGGHALDEDLDNEADGGVTCWLNGTRRSAVEDWAME